GHISLLLGDIVPAQNIFAFEPLPVSFKRLTENWTLNGWATDNLFQAAVGPRQGTVFCVDADNPITTNRVFEGQPINSQRIPISMVRLDDCLEAFDGHHIGLLKVDVEGYEPEVFLGARGFISEFKPRLIMFESLGGWVEPEIRKILEHSGYTLF